MNKFDRVTSILIYLQTRSVVTAQELSERFDVSERTIYRDIRSLENAGVPIGSEAGVGYFLEKNYRLPPVMFTRDEAAAMLIGAKMIDTRVDEETRAEYFRAMDKIKSVLESSDQDFLSAIDDNIMVQAPKSPENTAQQDTWLRESRTALARSQVLLIDYAPRTDQQQTTREIEPIGLYYYSQHWHLISWCRMRDDYRDFRLDRIRNMTLRSEQFRRREHPSLKEYLDRDKPGELQEIVVLFSSRTANFVGEQRYFFGYVKEQRTEQGTEMTFLTSQPDYFGRWILQFTAGVKIIKGDALRQVMNSLAHDLNAHWRISS